MTSQTAVTTIQLGINRMRRGEKLPPGDPDWGRYTHSFHTETHSIDSFMDLIRQGFAFSPTMTRSHRLKSNFISAQHLVLDFDDGDISSDLATLLADPWIRENAAFVYSTPSSTLEEPRSRVVCVLSEPVTDMETADRMMRGLVEKFPTSDQTVGEASRFLYGANPETGILIPIGKILDLEEAKKLMPLVPAPQERAAPPPRRPYRAPAAGMQYTVLAILREYTTLEEPRYNSNPRSRWTCRCPVCPNPLPHERYCFSIADDNDLWRCFSCLQHGNARTLLRLLGGVPEPLEPEHPPWEPRDEDCPFDQEEEVEVGIIMVDAANFDRRQAVIEGYFWMGEDDIANRVRWCAIWKKVGDMDCGTKVGRSYHCNKKGCPNCDAIRLIQFFEEKDAKLVETLTDPVMLKFETIFRSRLVGEYEEDADIVREGFKRVRDLLTDMGVSLGKRYRIGKDLIYALLCNCKDGVATFGVALLANREENDLVLVEDYFSRKTGRPIEGRRTTGEKDRLVRFFSLIAAGGFSWETNAEFYAWVKAMKGRKMIQGKGIFHGISGSKPSKKEMSDTDIIICPKHLVEETVRWTRLIAPPRAWLPKAVGQIYSIMVEGGERTWLHLEEKFKGRREQYD